MQFAVCDGGWLCRHANGLTGTLGNWLGRLAGKFQTSWIDLTVGAMRLFLSSTQARMNWNVSLETMGCR